MDSQYLAKAIKKLHPEAEFTFKNADYSTIEWIVLEGDAPTLKELEAAVKVVKQEEATAQAEKEAARAAILARLGITAEEAALLLA
jgi:hypothetical protein